MCIEVVGHGALLATRSKGLLGTGTTIIHMCACAQASKATGALTLQKVLDMKEAGVEVSSFISEELRANLYSQEVPATAQAARGVGSTCVRVGQAAKCFQQRIQQPPGAWHSPFWQRPRVRTD